MPSRRIVLLAFPQVQSLDLFGPMEVFSLADRAVPESYEIEVIARRCGFRTVETLRRTFSRLLRVSPTDYRKRFAA